MSDDAGGMRHRRRRVSRRRRLRGDASANATGLTIARACPRSTSGIGGIDRGRKGGRPGAFDEIRAATMPALGPADRPGAGGTDVDGGRRRVD